MLALKVVPLLLGSSYVQCQILAERFSIQYVLDPKNLSVLTTRRGGWNVLLNDAADARQLLDDAGYTKTKLMELKPEILNIVLENARFISFVSGEMSFHSKSFSSASVEELELLKVKPNILKIVSGRYVHVVSLAGNLNLSLKDLEKKFEPNILNEFLGNQIAVVNLVQYGTFSLEEIIELKPKIRKEVFKKHTVVTYLVKHEILSREEIKTLDSSTLEEGLRKSQIKLRSLSLSSSAPRFFSTTNKAEIRRRRPETRPLVSSEQSHQYSEKTPLLVGTEDQGKLYEPVGAY